VTGPYQNCWRSPTFAAWKVARNDRERAAMLAGRVVSNCESTRLSKCLGVTYSWCWRSWARGTPPAASARTATASGTTSLPSAENARLAHGSNSTHELADVAGRI
jgi:hypothetical protein